MLDHLDIHRISKFIQVLYGPWDEKYFLVADDDESDDEDDDAVVVVSNETLRCSVGVEEMISSLPLVGEIFFLFGVVEVIVDDLMTWDDCDFLKNVDRPAVFMIAVSPSVAVAFSIVSFIIVLYSDILL